MPVTIAYFLGTHEDWGGASRALLNFVRAINKDLYRPVVMVTRPGKLSRQLESEGIECLVWSVPDRGKNLLRYLTGIWRSVRMLHKYGIQILHINYSAIGWKPAEILAARILRLPVINHLHISVGETSSFMRYSSAVIAVSKYVADHSDSKGVPAKVIHNISDLQRFGHGRSIRGEFGFSPSDVVVAFLGQLIKAKGLDMFVEVAKRIADPRAKFIVGGPLRNTQGAYTEAEVKDLLSADPRIRYVGYRADAENLYATSDIIVMPSQWEEPCAMILFEAAAAGKPLVATATGGTPEVLRHGETGFLVAPHDVAEMTEYVNLLIQDADLRAQLGGRAKRFAQEELAIAPVRNLEQLYETLAAR